MLRRRSQGAWCLIERNHNLRSPPNHCNALVSIILLCHALVQLYVSSVSADIYSEIICLYDADLSSKWKKSCILR